jgi:hypothetical protein
MELIDIWHQLRRWWWLIAIPTVITILFALPSIPGAISPPETYGATIRFSAAAPPDAENALAAASDELARSGTYEDTSYVPWLASEYLVVNMPAWITSSSFAREVSERLAADGVDIPADDLRPALNADSVRSTLTVYYGWDDETELEAIAAASVDVLQTETVTYFPQLATEPAIIIPFDDVDVVQTAPPITARLQPFVTILVGIAAGIGLAVLAAFTDNTVRDRDDLEQLAIPVLGDVPRG